MSYICHNCNNSTICKYKDEAKQIEDSVSEIKIDVLKPFTIKIDCRHYRINETQRSAYETLRNSMK